MMHGFQQIVTEAECRDNFVVHGLPPLGDEIAGSPLIWRKKLMDSISGNLGFTNTLRQRVSRLVRATLSFSTKLAHHIGAIKYCMCHYNLTRTTAAALPV